MTPDKSRKRWVERREALFASIQEESGQSTVEYGTIAAALTLGFFIAGRPLFIALTDALQIYFDSFYFLLRLPIP